MLTSIMTGMPGCIDLIVLGDECDGGASKCDPRDDSLPEAGSFPEAGSAPVDANTATCLDGAPDESCLCTTRLPLARWTFDETEGSTSHEASGLGPTGALMNFAEASWMPGYAGGALHFDGRDDVVAVGAVGAIRTLSLWVKPEGPLVIMSQTASLLPSAHGPLDEWSHPELAYADDGMEATAGTLLVTTQAQHWRGFHLAKQVPRDAQILGITVTVDAGNLGFLGYFSVQLSWDAGVSHTNAPYTWGQLIVNSQLRQAGGPDRLWDRSWTPTNFLDENFAVRGSFGGIANSMDIDFLAVQVHYVEQTSPRTLLSLNDGTRVEFARDSSRALTLVGWPDAHIFVNGSLNALLTDEWNHVVITSSAPTLASDLRLGDYASAFFTVPFQGALDELSLFAEEVSPEEIATPYVPPSGCPQPAAP